MNYKEILSKIKKLLQWWKQRDLTLTGKIQLLKTFAMTKLTYVCSLMAVPNWVFKEVEKLVFDFIWKGKDKIKRRIMVRDYEWGGLKMIDFEKFIWAQRIMWLKRLLFGEEKMMWKLYVEHIFRQVGGKFIFQCKYDTNLLPCKLPPYYIEMLKVWQSLQDCRVIENDSIANEIILNNKSIRVNGRMVFNELLYCKNIYRVGHILDSRCQLKTLSQLQYQGLSFKDTFLIYGIYDAMPKEWKRLPLQGNVSHRVDNDIRLDISGKVYDLYKINSNKIYRFFITGQQTLQELNELSTYCSHFTEKQIRQIFWRPRLCSVDISLREFQFKLLHGIIFTNDKLHRIGVRDDDLCSFCKQETENYEHVFFMCPKVKELWQEFFGE